MVQIALENCATKTVLEKRTANYCPNMVQTAQGNYAIQTAEVQ